MARLEFSFTYGRRGKLVWFSYVSNLFLTPQHNWRVLIECITTHRLLLQVGAEFSYFFCRRPNAAACARAHYSLAKKKLKKGKSGSVRIFSLTAIKLLVVLSPSISG